MPLSPLLPRRDPQRRPRLFDRTSCGDPAKATRDNAARGRAVRVSRHAEGMTRPAGLLGTSTSRGRLKDTIERPETLCVPLLVSTYEETHNVYGHAITRQYL
jgi:hypothetical protein